MVLEIMIPICIMWIASAICVTSFLVNRQNVHSGEIKHRTEQLNRADDIEVQKMYQENRKLELEIRKASNGE